MPLEDNLDGAEGRVEPAARREAEETVRGPVATGVGRARPMEGNAAVPAPAGRDALAGAAAALGFSLSHESKKSSSVLGVLAPARGVSSSPSM